MPIAFWRSTSATAPVRRWWRSGSLRRRCAAAACTTARRSAMLDLTIRVEHLDSVVAYLDAMPGRVQAEIVASIEMLTGQLRARVIERLTGGNPLYSRS